MVVHGYVWRTASLRTGTEAGVSVLTSLELALLPHRCTSGDLCGKLRNGVCTTKLCKDKGVAYLAVRAPALFYFDFLCSH